MVRPPCCDKANVKRGLWTAEEDAKILAYVSKHGTGNWTLVPKKAGLNRCGKSCRLRWTNYLRPDLKHDTFSPQEEQLIINYHQAIGSRWSVIAKKLPGRTDNDVKNYWNTKLRKKLEKMGIDPITHKPISQIMFDYKTISSATTTLQSPRTTPHQQEAPPSFYNTCFPSWNLLQARRFTTSDIIYSPSPSPSSSSTVTTMHVTSPEPTPFHPQIPTYPPRTSFFMNKTLEPPDLLVPQHLDASTFPLTMMNPNPSEEASSNGDAFVNALLDEDTRIQSEIGDLLDGILDY